MTSVFIVAVESSGDILGANLIKALRAEHKTIEITGVGGSAMAAQGIKTDIDVSDLAVLGFIEALKIYPLVLERVKQVSDMILTENPMQVVLIDSWGFMIRVARTLKRAGYKGRIVKYVAPQVWAMREGRAKLLAKSVDHLLSLHSFDAPFFEKHGLETTYIGNPVFEEDFDQGDGMSLRAKYNISKNTKIIAVLFGSRLSEVQTLAEPFAQAITNIKALYKDVCFISPVSEAIATDVGAAAGHDLRLQNVILLPEARKWDIFDAADVALSCSGTVTTQLACMGVPSVVAYKLNPVTYFFAKWLYKPKYISIVNIAAKRCLMPEFIQRHCTGENLSNAVHAYLIDPEKSKKAEKDLRTQTLKMAGRGGTGSLRAAKAILALER